MAFGQIMATSETLSNAPIAEWQGRQSPAQFSNNVP
jgi:hypothetical protein